MIIQIILSILSPLVTQQKIPLSFYNKKAAGILLNQDSGTLKNISIIQ